MGLGLRMIDLLTQFGFEKSDTNIIYGCGIANYNPRSRRAFERKGYRVEGSKSNPFNANARAAYDMI